MGRLKFAESGGEKNSPLFLYKSNKNYKNIHAIDYGVHYITRTGTQECRKEQLLCWGAIGVYMYSTVEDTIEAMNILQVQMRGKKNIGPRLAHEQFIFDDEQTLFFRSHPELAYAFAHQCAMTYYNLGHQVAFAIHYEPEQIEKGMHLHFIVSSVNIATGKKLHITCGADQRTREAYMNGIYNTMKLANMNAQG